MTLGEGAVVPRGARTEPSSSQPPHLQQGCCACRLLEANPRCSRWPIASAGKTIISGPVPAWRSGCLFTIIPITGGIANAQIAMLDLRTGTSKVLIRGGSHAQYVPTGHLVYGVAGTLRAVAFDLGRLEVAGTPTLVVDGVMTSPSGAIEAAISANGSLVYLPGGAGIGEQLSVCRWTAKGMRRHCQDCRWTRTATSESRLTARGSFSAPRERLDYDFARATLSRPTTDPTATRPLWTPDGQRIVFTSRRAGYPELFWRAADGSGSEERLLTRAKNLTGLRANGWSADGRQLLYAEVSPESGVSHIPIEPRQTRKRW